jgi:hypothetical protein
MYVFFDKIKLFFKKKNVIYSNSHLQIKAFYNKLIFFLKIFKNVYTFYLANYYNYIFYFLQIF